MVLTLIRASAQIKIRETCSLYFARQLHVSQLHGRQSPCQINNNNVSTAHKLSLHCERIHPLSVISSVGIRYASTSPIKDLPPIPEAPPVPAIDETIQETISQIAANGEPTFASLGLGGWTPIGIVQNCMEFLHVSWDIPWWGVIAIGTVCVRTILFPLVILTQRNAAKMHNNMPQMQVLQMKMTEARQMGDSINSARYAQEMLKFMKEKKLSPFKNMIVPFAQAPIFISFFMGLRGMANTPVQSLTEGGLFWFVDLTMNDNMYLLPIITSATMALTIELGADSAKLSSQNMQTMRYVLRALPLCILPFTINFPAAILCYWTCSNFISLAQVGFLKLPKVRKFFKIDQLQTFEPETLPIKKKKFVEGIKESWTNMKITNELQERQRMDEIQFSRAGKGPLVKTYRHDPTKPKPSTSPAITPTLQAKKS